MNPLEPADAAVLLSLVNPGGRSGLAWATKVRIIMPVAHVEGGDWWNAPDVAVATGVPVGTARRLLAELERQRVITRDGVDGGKVFWVELDADWRRWEVEWSMPLRDVELRLEYARSRRSRSGLDRLLSRTLGARSHSVIARLCVRDNARLVAQNGRVIAHPGRAITRPGSRALGARKIGGLAKERSLLEAESDTGTSSSLVDRKEEEGKQHPKWGLVRSVYARTVGASAVYGTPATKLAVLLATYGPDRLLAAIGAAPEGPGVALLVDELETMLQQTPEDEAVLASVTPLVETDHSEERVAHLRRLVATYEEQGAEPPEGLVNELARCHDEVTVIEE